MNTLIMAVSHDLNQDQVSRFLNTLTWTGYSGDLCIISNDLNVDGAIKHPWNEDSTYFRSSRRLFSYYDFLQSTEKNYDTVITAGIRDVLFQKNPEFMPHEEVCIYRENENPPIGSCPYNSRWIRNSYGEDMLDRLSRKFIICAEIMVGTKRGMMKLLKDMIDEAESNPRKYDLEDQGILNKMFHTGQLPYVTCMHNEYSPVYTVGYVPYVRVRKHQILNESLEVPYIVHQYDRHL